MGKIFIIITFNLPLLFALELAVIGDENFPENNLSKEQIKAFFLNKKSFIAGEKILVMNHETGTSLRNCFEKKILEKSKQSLERYWRKAYYQGKRPPKVVTSVDMLFLYFKNVTPSLGYSELNTTRNESFKILYRVECEES